MKLPPERKGEQLQWMFRLHLEVNGQSFANDLRQVRLRPKVLEELLGWLFEHRRDLFRHFRSGNLEFLKAMQARIHDPTTYWRSRVDEWTDEEREDTSD